MREHFERHGKGDQLSAKFINQIAKVVRRTGMGGAGSFTRGIRGTYDATIGLPPTVLQQVIVSQVAGSLIKCYVRLYNHSTLAWETDLAGAAREHDLDTTETGISVSEGDKLLAYWHPQRRAFMPASTSPSVILKAGKASGASIAAGATNGQVTIWELGVATDEVLTGVRHDWITNATAIAVGTEVFVGWFRDEAAWRIIGAECPE